VTKDPRVYLAHILECIQKIEQFTQEGRRHFFQDAMVQDAVLRNLEVIGEAAKRLDDSYREAHPQIPWRALAGLRDVLIHQYESVELDRVWAIVEGELPGLREAIAALLPPLEQLERELAGEDETSESK
jgi:uncharacterized protein with HEPN domain